DFRLHNHRQIPVKLDFATKNQSEAQQQQILTTLHQMSWNFDHAARHLHVWCVKEWGAFDVGRENARGTTHKWFIIFEDSADSSLPDRILAHELGHALGLWPTEAGHNPNKEALMYKTVEEQGKKLFKDEYRTLLRFFK